MEWLIALIALTAMEIVLGIDNIVFIAILTGRLPKRQQPTARRLGLTVALGTRILLLLTLTWILGLTKPLFVLRNMSTTLRQLPSVINVESDQLVDLLAVRWGPAPRPPRFLEA